MTKYRIRQKNGRVIGPFALNQLQELMQKGHIQGNEDAQVYPTGDWKLISLHDFYENLKNTKNHTPSDSDVGEQTFVLDLSKLKLEKNLSELDELEDDIPTPEAPNTETIKMEEETTVLPMNEEKKVSKPVIEEVEEEIEREDKTLINPVAQEEIAKLKRQQEAEDKRQREAEEKARLEEEARKLELEVRRAKDADQSTQMIRLDDIKYELIESASEEEKKIKKIEKQIKKKKKLEDDADEEVEENSGKDKKKKILIVIATLIILYVFMFPEDESKKKPKFVHIDPQVEFPIPYDKADSQRSKIEFEKAMKLFVQGDYISIIKSGILFKSSYENNLENTEALGMLVRSFAEQMKDANEKRPELTQILFNLIQAKRPYLAKDPNGVIGINLFYMSINKIAAAEDVVSKYLKVYPQNPPQDLFAIYLDTLLKLGKLDKARQFRIPLVKAPQKNQYTYDALINYALLNQEFEDANNYADEALKRFPNDPGFYLRKAEMLLRDNKVAEIEPYLAKVDELNFGFNKIIRAKYFQIIGLIYAYKGDVKNATKYIQGSLKVIDSVDLRMKLADLSVSSSGDGETDKLILESKSMKLLNQSKEVLSKRNYELALSLAAKATDIYPGYIPSEIHLSKVQMQLGLIEQSLNTLRALAKKYPEDNNISIALVEAYIETYKFNDAKNLIGVLSASELKNTAQFAAVNGKLYIKMGDSLQAITWLKNAMNLNPLDDSVIFLLTEMLLKRSNFDAARQLLNRCMELDPLNPDYRIAYSKIVYEMQDDQAAVGYLLGLLDDFVDNPKILSEIAIFYYRSGKVKDFLAYKEKLEKLPNKDASLYDFLIRAALLDEKYDEIPKIVDELLRIEPGDINAMMTAGRVLFENGKLVEAAKWFKRIQDRLDTYPKVQYYIAMIKFLSGDLAGAKIDVEKDLKANGENDADLTLLGKISVAQGELVEAENYFKKAQKINPRAYEALVGLADISTKRNNFDLALDLYKKAQNIKPEEAIVHKKIGDVFRLLGQGALAVESYKMYLEMNPDASDKRNVESYINLMN